MATIWIPKIKNGYQIATLLGSHLGAKREPNGSHFSEILTQNIIIFRQPYKFFKK